MCENGNGGANDAFTQGRDIPWLQDTGEAEWWDKWGVAYRDVVIVDADGDLAGVYNLTSHDLGETDNYVELKKMLLDVAEGN